MSVRIRCADRYESRKLASLIYRDDGETHIARILNIVENEVVISVKDESAHSILLRDGIQAERFADFVQSILECEHRIIRVATLEEEVAITKG